MSKKRGRNNHLGSNQNLRASPDLAVAGTPLGSPENEGETKGLERKHKENMRDPHGKETKLKRYNKSQNLASPTVIRRIFRRSLPLSRRWARSK